MRNVSRLGALAFAMMACFLARGGAPADRAGTDSGTRGIRRENFDPAVRAQDDFFRHVNGAWIQRAEIPAERAYYGAFIELVDKAEANVHAIIEGASASNPAPGSVARKIADMYASFMDEARIEALGRKPIQTRLDQIAALQERSALTKLLIQFDHDGEAGVFAAMVMPDRKQSDTNILYLGQGGISLPDESYYRDPKFEDVRKAFRAHVEEMLKLAGFADPCASAERVVGLETKIAKGHLDRVKSRDRTLTYNKMNREALDALTPGFDWAAWLDEAGAKDVAELVVLQPKALEATARLLREEPLETWKDWLSWQIVHANAPALSREFARANFEFFGKTLTGATEERPRWKRGVAAVEGALGEGVGKLYVERHFPAEARARMRELVNNLIEAYRQSITSLDWMSPETRAKALEKLGKFTPKIGHPEVWRDYSKLEVEPGDLVGNIRRSHRFEVARQIEKLRKPVDRSEWLMTPQTVNAYYNPAMNEIVFPAAILQPPYFDVNADDAVNYGAIGGVIGHEIGHGFDDQGSKFDGDGNMKDWWTEADRKEFERRAKMLIEQYNGYAPRQLPDQHVNGALTIGENIGDLGGLSIASKAYAIARRGKPSETIAGLTPEQRLFVGWAQGWRSKYRDQEVRRRLAVDSHSPPEFRVNGVVRNVPAFHEAFGVKEGDKLWLAPEQRVRIW